MLQASVKKAQVNLLSLKEGSIHSTKNIHMSDE